MDKLNKIFEKISKGEALTLDEFDHLRMYQEQIDDNLEVIEGRKLGLRVDNFSFRTSGAGVAIVVGHTANSPGASGTDPINQSEYPWNKDLALKIKAKCQSMAIESRIFYRDGIRKRQQDVEVVIFSL